LSSPCGSSCRASQILLKHSKSCLLNLNPCTVVCILYLILAHYYVTTPFITICWKIVPLYINFLKPLIGILCKVFCLCRVLLFVFMVFFLCYCWF
jgi:hypothetical protein